MTLQANNIYDVSCIEGLKQMDDSSVDMFISSPPYNVGIEYGAYGDTKPWEEYELFMENLLTEMFRVLRDGGRVAWNIPSFSSKQNLYEIFLKLFRKVGFMQYAEIIWDKKQISSRTAWGSWLSASQPNILPSHEYILVFYKNNKNYGKGKSDITKEEFISWTNGMWSFKPETKSKHPAPFPVELPYRLIKFFTYPDDLVIDPFMGSGTTALACIKTGRKCIGFEIDPAYIAMASERIMEYKNTKIEGLI